MVGENPHAQEFGYDFVGDFAVLVGVLDAAGGERPLAVGVADERDGITGVLEQVPRGDGSGNGIADELARFACSHVGKVDPFSTSLVDQCVGNAHGGWRDESLDGGRIVGSGRAPRKALKIRWP